MTTYSNIAQIIIALSIVIIWVFRFYNVEREFKLYLLCCSCCCVSSLLPYHSKQYSHEPPHGPDSCFKPFFYGLWHNIFYINKNEGGV